MHDDQQRNYIIQPRTIDMAKVVFDGFSDDELDAIMAKYSKLFEEFAKL